MLLYYVLLFPCKKVYGNMQDDDISKSRICMCISKIIMLTCKLLIFLEILFFKIGYASNDIMNARCNIIVLTNNLFVSTCELIMLTCDRVMWTPVWIFRICDLFMSMCEITMLHFNFLRIYVMWCNATYWCLLFVILHATTFREV